MCLTLDLQLAGKFHAPRHPSEGPNVACETSASAPSKCDRALGLHHEPPAPSAHHSLFVRKLLRSYGWSFSTNHVYRHSECWRWEHGFILDTPGRRARRPRAEGDPVILRRP